MSVRSTTIIAVAAAAATYFVAIDTADAQFRSFSGGGGGGGGGNQQFRTLQQPRSFTPQRSFTQPRTIQNNFSTTNRSFSPAQRVTQGNPFQRAPQLNGQTLRTPQLGNQTGNRPTLPGGQTVNQGGNNPNRPGLGNTTQAGNQTGNRPALPGGQTINQGGNNANRPGLGNNQAANQGGNRPGSGNTLAPNLRSGLGLGNVRPGNLVPSKISVPATNLKLGRIAPPQNLVPRLTLAAAPAGFAASRWKPFLQRHWRSAFFWIAIPTIGYVTVPDWAYERFATFIEVPEPDYDGAVKYLSQVAVQEEGARVVRVAQAPAATQIRHTVAVAPEAALEQRFQAFVNRQWSSEFVWISVPRIGNITCPVAVFDQVQSMLTQNPPRFADALAVLEEAAANDTVVEEGALNDQSVESVQ